MPGTYKLLISYMDGGSQYAANVLHFASDEASGGDEWQNSLSFGLWCQANLAPVLAPCVSSDCIITGFTVERIAPTGGPAAFVAYGGSGTGPTTMGSGSIGGQVKWIATTASRKPGRMTVPSPPSTYIIKDKIVSAYSAVLNTLAALLQGSINDGFGNTLTLGIWSKKLALLDRVAHFELNLKIGVQRRRLLRTM